MSKQLKELRRLMPWTWDSRVEEHPPGEKALHDFENVVKFDFDGSRRRGSKAPVYYPTTAGSHKPKASAAAKDNDNSSKADKEPPATVARPTTGGAPSKDVVGSTPAVPPPTTKATPAGRQNSATPGTFLKSAATPNSTVPSSSRPTTVAGRFHAALADGHFLPTPGDTPATLGDKEQQQQHGFKNPLPRTVFADKKRTQTGELPPMFDTTNQQQQQTAQKAALPAKKQRFSDQIVINAHRVPAPITNNQAAAARNNNGHDDDVVMEDAEYYFYDDEEDMQQLQSPAVQPTRSTGGKNTHRKGNRNTPRRPSAKKATFSYDEDLMYDDDEEYSPHSTAAAVVKPATVNRSSGGAAGGQKKQHSVRFASKPSTRQMANTTITMFDKEGKEHNLLLESDVFVARHRGPMPPTRPSICPPLFTNRPVVVVAKQQQNQQQQQMPKENVSALANANVGGSAGFFAKEKGLVNLVQGGGVLAAVPTLGGASSQIAVGDDGDKVAAVVPVLESKEVKVGSTLMAAFQVLNKQRQQV